MQIIQLTKINKYFGSQENQTHVLKNINLQIEKGDFVAIIGQSGSGKSTLMNIIGCLDTPSSGSYQINGVEVGNLQKDQLAELRCHTFGFIFQRYNLLSSLTALENVTLPAIYSGMSAQLRHQRAKQLLSDIELQHRLANKPSELSGGQQQRVSIARALMNGGDIILADEPTGALDSASGEMVMRITKQLHQQGHTIILVTHDPKIAAQASRTIEIKDGEIIADRRQDDQFYTAPAQLPVTTPTALNYLKYHLSEALKMSVHAIMAHKMRSILTMLGIIIGITAVVSVIALGRGSQQKILADINSMGTNTIDILPGTGFGDMHAGKIKTLTVQDSDILAQQSYVDSSTPNLAAAGTLVYENISVTAQLSGVGAQYFAVKGTEIESGRQFDLTDVQRTASVVVIDHNAQEQLFPNGENPIGKVVLFNKKPLEIIGVAKKKNTPGPMGNSINLYAPYTTVMYKVKGTKHISSITVKIADTVNSQMAEQNLIHLLTVLHGKTDFFTINTDSIKQTVESTVNTMTLLISCIALISLVVGGIGVMNIMLVSVTERTKEIGIRMAIGAKQSDILEQFLIEAILICLIGGLAGVAFSILIGFSFNRLVTSFAMNFSTESILLAILCSTAIGIVFGFMPAKNASNLNPIDALAQD